MCPTGLLCSKQICKRDLAKANQLDLECTAVNYDLMKRMRSISIRFDSSAWGNLQLPTEIYLQHLCQPKKTVNTVNNYVHI